MAGQVKLAGGEWAQRVIYQGGSTYDAETLTIANLSVDFNAGHDGSGALYNRVPVAYYTEIRTNQDITVKLNGDMEPGISITSADSPYIIDHIATTGLFISNASGNPATVKVVLA